MMKYLKVFTDFASSLEPLGDAECGRLFKAMLEYARTGQEPDFRGNERFIWPTAKQSIDRDSETYRRKVDAALKATEKRYRTQMYDNVQKETSTCDNAQDKDKDKDKDDARTRAGSSKGREAPRAEDSAKRYRKPEACDPPQGEGAGRSKGREAPSREDMQGHSVHGTWPECSSQRLELHGPNKIRDAQPLKPSAAAKPATQSGAGRSKGREAPRAEDTPRADCPRNVASLFRPKAGIARPEQVRGAQPFKRYRKPEACDPPQGEGAGRNKGREAPRAKDSGITAPLLSEEEADRLGTEYTRNMQTLLAALEDVGMKPTARNEQAAEALMAQYGTEKVLAAIDTAAEHDNRGGVSWAYLRRILEDGPRQSAAGKPAATRTIRECCVVDGQEVWTERVVRAQ